MKQISIHSDCKGPQPRLAYVVSCLQRHPLKPPEVEVGLNKPVADISVRYSQAEPEPFTHFHIPAQHLFFSREKPASRALWANPYRFSGRLVFSVENRQLAEQPLLIGQNFQFDILEAVFFHLSRYEEYFADPADWDEWDMLRGENHFLVRHRLHHQPIVDQLIATFFQALGFSIKRRPVQWVLTHDFDALLKFPSLYRSGRAAVRLLAHGEFRKLPRLARLFLETRTGARPDPFDTFDWLLAKTEVSKVVFMMAGGLTRYDNHYNIRSAKAREVIRLAQERGYRIGLHPSYACWKNKEQFLREKQELEAVAGQEITLSRQHFLHFCFKETIDILEELQIQEDHTLGYQDRIGFRCGASFPFPLYNFKKECISPVTEVPMAVMDGALLGEALLVSAEPYCLLKDFLDANEGQSQVSVNFHNSSFDGVDWEAEKMKALYRFVLGKAAG